MAGARKIGSIYAELSLRDQMTVGLARASKSLEKFKGAYSGAVGALGLGGLATGLAIGTKHAIALGDDLGDLHNRTGIAISSLMLLGQAYKDNGREAESLGQDINRMQKAIFLGSEDSTQDPFAQIGLSARQLMGLKPEEQFFRIADAINRIEDPAKKAAVAMQIFGKSGGALLPVFAGANLKQIRETLGDMPALMEKYGDKFNAANDIMERWSTKSNQFFTGVAASIIDDLLPALERLNSTDFSSAGVETGRAIKDAGKFFYDGLDNIVNGIIKNIPLIGDGVGLLALTADKMGSELGYNGVMNSDGSNGGMGRFNHLPMEGVMLPGERNGNLPDILNREWVKTAKERAEAMAQYNNELERYDAMQSGDKERLRELEKEWEIHQKINELIKEGYNMQEASQMANALADAKFAAEDATKKNQSWEQLSYQTNDMIGRGFALSGMTAKSKDGKSIALLSNIRDLLKEVTKNRQQLWNL